MADDNLSWGDLAMDDEMLNSDDVKNVDRPKGLPVGKYVGRVESSTPKEVNGKNYTFYQANLKLIVIEVLSIDGRDPTSDEENDLDGKFAWDSVNMYHADEKEGVKKRRVFVACRFGLISTSSDKITPSMWQHDIIGKEVIFSVEENWYEKDGKPKQGANKIGGFSYEAVTESADTTDDEDFGDV